MNETATTTQHGILLLLIGICLFSTTLDAAESAGHFDPRQFDRLNQVIILCATEPDSERFAATWRSWVEENPEADVHAAVNTVVSRAGTYRGMAIPGMEPVRHGRRPDPDAIADYMLSLVGKRPLARFEP